MSCGCVDNKNLDKDKLSLESMQNLSIDEIISLYRQGYTLEESENFTGIRSLAISSLQFQYAMAVEGVPSSGKIRIAWIWSNTGGYGYGQFKFYDYTTGVEIGAMPSSCYDPGPAQLYRLSTYDINYTTAPLDIRIKAYKCSSDTQQSCPAGTCTAPVESSQQYTALIPPGVMVPPSTPSTLTITPGNGSLTLSWSAVSNTPMLGYHIVIKVGTTTVIDGYWSQNVGPVTISGLTNDISHSVSVSAISASGAEGTAKTGSGTPSLPTPVLTTITITPTTASINIGATQQLTAVCKDQNGTVMTCPILTWLSSDTSKATVISSGLVTGVAVGSTNITAGASGVTSNVSVITVNPLTCTAITNVSATPNPVTQGQTTTLTATTTPAIAGFNVIFKDGATTLQTVTTNSSGVATYPWPTAGQSTGAHSITASVGTPAQCTSISATTVTISPPSCTSITLFVSPTSVIVGETVTLTATTNPTIAGFNVIFKDGAAILQTVVTNSSGVAIYQWSTAGQSIGAHPLTASVGTPAQCTSSMTTVTIGTVQQNCTAITNVSATPNPVTQGQTTTLTATTTPAIAGFSVVFKDGVTTLSTQTTNSSGVATYPWPTAGQSIGAHSITASVAGQCTSISATTVTVTTVAQVLTSISPASAIVQIDTTQQFTAKDQNGSTIATGVAWVKTAGVGSINGTTGLYSAGPTDGIATISATYGGVTKTAQITVTTTPPPQAGGGGAIMIAAVAAIGIAYFMMRKPPTKP